MNKPSSPLADYISSAPKEGRAHLLRVYEILREVAPEAEEAIKWNVPFFVEPRFLFSFSAFKAHLAFVPGPETLAAFAEELKGHETTKNFLKVRYCDALPEELIRRMAEYQLLRVKAQEDDSFW